MPSPTVLLAADLGGTRARFLLARSDGNAPVPIAEATLAVGAHQSPEDACAAFLAGAPDVRIDRACIAVAGPTDGRTARFTNARWRVEAHAFASRFGIARMELCNDFVAAASGLDDLDAGALLTLQPGVADPRGARVLIGAGTGLGVAYVLADGSPPRIVAGEGGHAGFAPADAEQVELWRFLAPALPRVTAEHVLSGAGLVRLYAFASRERGPLPDDVGERGAAAVAERDRDGDPCAKRALRLFAAIFGGVAGDHALSVMATGGVWIAGGLAVRLEHAFGDGTFTEAFRAKAPHAALMAGIPVSLVRDERLGLLGAMRRAST